LGFDPKGDAVVVWLQNNGSHRVVEAAIRPAGAVWQAPVNVSNPSGEAFEPRIAVDSHGDAFAVWQLYNGSNEIIQGAIKPSGGTWEPPVDLSESGEDAFEPHVAVNAQGEAVAVWRRRTATGEWVLQAASRRTRGTWHKPLNISQAAIVISEPDVAVGPYGEALAVWDVLERVNGSGEYTVHDSFRSPNGAWQAPARLSKVGGLAYRSHVAFDSQGNATAVWVRTIEHEGEDFVQAATRPAGRGWLPAVNISELGQADEQQIAVDPQGDAIVVWDRYNRSARIVQAATRSMGGTWQPPVDVSETAQTTSDPYVAVDGHGNAVAVWRRDTAGPYTLQAAGYDTAGPLLENVTIPTEGTTGQSLSFTVSPLDVWSPLGPTTWKFGDGSSATGRSVTHTYSAAGSYQVRLDSEDILGNKTSSSAAITIAPPSATPPTVRRPASPYARPR
jgi:hypothetical protein